MSGEKRRDRVARASQAGRPAHRIFGRSVAASAAAYDRTRDLPRLLALWPQEIEDWTDTRRLHLLAKLRRALRAERRRARSGHWSYDLNRHLGLLSAYKAELADLASARPSRIERRGPQRNPPECENNRKE
jgi:hypothetical protein